MDSTGTSIYYELCWHSKSAQQFYDLKPGKYTSIFTDMTPGCMHQWYSTMHTLLCLQQVDLSSDISIMIICHITVECHYKAAQYNMIFAILQQWLRHYLNPSLYWQKTPQLSPSWASCGGVYSEDIFLENWPCYYGTTLCVCVYIYIYIYIHTVTILLMFSWPCAHLVSRVSRPQFCWGLAILCDPPFFSGYIGFGGVVVKFYSSVELLFIFWLIFYCSMWLCFSPGI